MLYFNPFIISPIFFVTMSQMTSFLLEKTKWKFKNKKILGLSHCQPWPWVTKNFTFFFFFLMFTLFILKKKKWGYFWHFNKKENSEIKKSWNMGYLHCKFLNFKVMITKPLISSLLHASCRSLWRIMKYEKNI
jgi:hypothetical protein